MATGRYENVFQYLPAAQISRAKVGQVLLRPMVSSQASRLCFLLVSFLSFFSRKANISDPWSAARLPGHVTVYFFCLFCLFCLFFFLFKADISDP